MNQQDIRNLTLFDLLARSWQRPAAIADLHFNADDTALAVSCADGTVAIARVADPEPPDKRMKTSADFGQTTIRPRKKPVAPLIATAVPAGGAAPLAAYLDSGFLVGTAAGEVIRLSHDGALAETLFKTENPVVAVDHSSQSGITAATDGCHLYLNRRHGNAVKCGHAEGQPIGVLALSRDGRRAATSSMDGLAIWRLDEESVTSREILLSSSPLSIRWSDDGRWLACGLEAGGFALVDVASGGIGTVSDFPTPVRTLSWSNHANALVASGAYRIAAWSMDAPPLGADTSGALVTGRAGLVGVEAVASHPARDLVAAGYANGQIVVARIGAADELLVRPMGGAVTALAWSADGWHLAAGDADGGAAIVTFPAHMFK